MLCSFLSPSTDFFSLLNRLSSSENELEAKFIIKKKKERKEKKKKKKGKTKITMTKNVYGSFE